MIRLAVGILSCIATVSAFADTIYTWKTVADGSWLDSDNWTGGVAGQYPGQDPDQATTKDTAQFPVGTMTLTADQDITVWNIEVVNNGVKRVTIDMGGHALTVLRNDANAFAINGVHTQVPDIGPDVANVEFRNGTFTVPKFFLGYVGENNSGGVTVSKDATLTCGIGYWDNGSRFQVKDGGLLKFTGDVTMCGFSCGSGYGFVCATGETSTVDFQGHSVTARGKHNGLYALDHGVITNVYNLYVGQSIDAPGGKCTSDDTFVDIRNGKVFVRNCVSLGWTADGSCSPRVSLSGPDAQLVVSNASNNAFLRIYGTLGAKLAFDLDAGAFVDGAGEMRAPLWASTLKFEARNEEYASYGDTKVVVTGYTWMREHGGETVPLIRLGAADPEKLQALADALDCPDFPSSLFTEDPRLVVSDDGLTLSFVVPPAKRPSAAPTFSAKVEPSLTEGAIDVSVEVMDFGYEATTVSGEITYGQESDLSDGVTAALFADATGTLPISRVTQVGGFPQHRHFFAKVVVSNENGATTTNGVEFTTGGISETLTWKAAVDGDWEVTDNWTSTDAEFIVRPQPPHAEDKANVAVEGSYTISMHDDATVATLGSIGSKKHPTIDLGGHTLTFSGKNGQTFYIEGGRDPWTSADDALPQATLTFKNGTVVSPDSAKFQLVGANTWATAGLVFDNCTFTGSPVYWDNACRVWIKNGAVWKVGAGSVTMNNYAASGEWGFLKVVGQGSCFDSKGKDLVVRGANVGLIVKDGGRAVCSNLKVGSDASATTGDQVSPNTYVEADNGTVEANQIYLGWSSDKQCGPRLAIAGEKALVQSQLSLVIYEKHGTRLEFTVPEDGFKDDDGNLRAPLVTGGISYTARPSATVDWGATKLCVNLRAFAHKHPRETIPLITFTTANAEALNALAATAELKGVRLSHYEAGTGPFTVSDDGKTLYLNAPPLQGVLLMVR